MNTSPLALGRRVMALIEDLAQHTDEPGRLTRLYLSPAHRRAAEATQRMMQEAGLAAHIDPAGSVVGRMEGWNPDAPAILIGSHIDSVVDAGRFDGNLGVVLGIVAAETLRAEGGPAAPIEVVAFGDEENVRFPTNLSTSSGLRSCFTFQRAWASVLAPPQTVTQTGRGSSRSTTAMIQFEPSESLPSPTPFMPNSGRPDLIRSRKNSSVG